jgi:hypothetical protein
MLNIRKCITRIPNKIILMNGEEKNLLPKVVYRIIYHVIDHFKLILNELCLDEIFLLIRKMSQMNCALMKHYLLFENCLI